MTVKLSYLLVGALAAVGAMTSAHADVVEVEGAHVKFVYNTDFWGKGGAVVSGDSITFATDPAFNLSRTAVAGGIEATYNAAALDALTVVAKSGYAVNLGVTTTYVGSFQLANGAGSGSMHVSGLGLMSGGSYDNGVFTSTSSSVGYGGGLGFSSVVSGGIDQHDVVPANGAYQALQASLNLSTAVTVASSGTSSVQLNSYGYAFTAAPLAAVPEPATYGMLLGGLGMLGMVARRRRGAPK